MSSLAGGGGVPNDLTSTRSHAAPTREFPFAVGRVGEKRYSALLLRVKKRARREGLVNKHTSKALLSPNQIGSSPPRKTMFATRDAPADPARAPGPSPPPPSVPPLPPGVDASVYLSVPLFNKQADLLAITISFMVSICCQRRGRPAHPLARLVLMQWLGVLLGLLHFSVLHSCLCSSHSWMG